MNKIIAFALTVALAGCQVHEKQEPAPPVERASIGTLESGSSVETYSSAATASGASVAANLTSRYNDTRQNCGKASMPAFLCAGIMLRATVPSTQYSSWNPSPRSQTSGGVSFSYLRKDAKFATMVYLYKNGFILAPVLARPTGTRQIEVLCSFPIDGATDQREDPGCGLYKPRPARSNRCQSQGITTGDQWLANFRTNNALCSFDVRDSMNNLGADSFYQTIRAHNLGKFMAGRHEYIELILATWPQNIPRELPIEAFFYVSGGLPGAQHDQTDYFAKTGGAVVPIIKLTMPTATTDAVFTYIAADQVKR
ncbi:halovibrin HvnA [Pseudomonas sp. UYIF39]|uniref:halovibrin HvnA n=1 Tax=Pseudomonas sp. UYIF39 TaxID=1630747 RepID=UPI00249F4BB8|nr:halovibrin HvnA [Pseudomonas sp. UYIF39]MDI3353191.1 halovibrin HvnA [Pseudomonas sp. UYIF39]